MTAEDIKKLKEANYEVADLALQGFVPTGEPIEEFVKNFLLTYNKKYDTIYAKDGSVQCERSAHRSLGDIFMITHHYYPGCTIDQVKRIILSLPGLVGHYCGDIDRRIFELADNYPGWSALGGSYLDEFGDPIEY